jgi:hypothetical protein
MASNIQRGTRGISGGDWIRLKRLAGARNYIIDQPQDVINPPPRLEIDNGRRVQTEFGTSNTRRPASFFTDYKASQVADYVLESGGAGNKVLLATKICNCLQTSNPVKHNGLCASCVYDKIISK